MCDICVMNSVKGRMLSRRNFFKSTAAVGIAAVATGASAPAGLAGGHSLVEDMTHTLHSEFPMYFGESQFSSEQIFNYAEHFFNLNQYTINEHTVTHIDAPLHFSEDGTSVDGTPVSEFVAPLCLTDIARRAEEDADTQVTPDDIRAGSRHMVISQMVPV